MTYEAMGLARYAGYSSAPKLLTASEPSLWRGAEFHEISLELDGSFGIRPGDQSRSLILSWIQAPLLIRLSRKDDFVAANTNPIFHLDDNSCVGEWLGSCRSLQLYVPEFFVEQALHLNQISVPDGPHTDFSSSLKYLLNLLHQDIRCGSPAGPAIGEAVILQILQYLYPSDHRSTEMERRDASSGKIKLAREMIEDNISVNISLNDLAKSVKLSTRHLTRAFHAATGLAPHEYIIQRRVARACDLIGHSKYTFAEIALRVGFASQSHMTTTFRRVLGRAPSHFSNMDL